MKKIKKALISVSNKEELIPLLNTLATNPTKSPVIPPPTPIIKSDLLKFFENKLFKKKVTKLRDFTFSFASKL